MPDLGKYTLEIALAYGVCLGLILALLGVSVWQARRMRARLAAFEAERGAR